MKKSKIFFITIIVLSIILFFTLINCSGGEVEEEVPFIWTEIESETSPEARWGHRMIYNNQNLILFGGYTTSAKGDTWSYSTINKKWTQINVKGDIETSGDLFEAYSYSIASIPEKNKVFRFGGINDKYNKMDITWEYDLEEKEWKVFFTNGLPPARFNSAMVYKENDTIIMFGGELGEGNYSNDLWECDINTQEWSEIVIDDKSTIPEARSGHTLNYIDDGKLILFGGITGNSTYTNDLWTYDTGNNKWSLINIQSETETDEGTEANATKPTAREGHSSIYIPEKNKLIIFGGYNGEYLGDMWEFEISTNNWKELTGNIPFPPVRSGHSMVYIGNNQTLLFGGKTGKSNLGDLWLLELKEESTEPEA